MRWLGMIGMRVRSLFGWNRAERELDEELRFHLEKQIEQNVASGMSLRAARYAALREFGGVAQLEEECRDQRRVNVIRDFVQDVGYALRGLGRDRGLALAATLTLAICIGANTTMFSLLNSILIRPLPYPDSHQLYWVSEQRGTGPRDVAVGADYYYVRESNKIFTEVAAFDTFTMNWTGIERPEVLRAAQVTPSFFRVMGTAPMLGRYLADGEEGPKAPPVAILSYAFWRNSMGGDAGIVGKTILLNGEAHQIIGVMPQGFNYPRDMQIWRPQPMDDASQRPISVTKPMRIVSIVARLRPEISPQQVESEIERLSSAVAAQYPQALVKGGWLNATRILASPLQQQMTGNVRPALMVLTGAVGLVLLIACANLANLLLARSSARRKELAVRMALGSGRGRIVRQLLTESLILALPGGFAGTLIAAAAVAGLNVWKPAVLAQYPEIVLDARTLAFTVGLTVLTGLVFGLAPALGAARTQVQDALKSASHQHSGGRAATRLRQALVVVELGVSLVLLIGAGLLAKSFVNLARTDLGFKPENVLTMRVRLRGERYATGEQQTGFYEAVMDRIRHLPNVRSVSVSTDIALSGEFAYSIQRYQIAGAAPVATPEQPSANITVVSREFFQTLGIPLRRGRIFDHQDGLRTPAMLVVNEAFVRQSLGAQDPLGRQVTNSTGALGTIVGVVGNIRGADLGVDPVPLAYRCTCQISGPASLTALRFVVRTDRDPRSVARAVEAEAYAVDRNQPVFEVLTMEERLSSALSSQRFQLVLIGIFAGIAIVLAAVGVYGVMSFLVALRRREMGIRIALGARTGQVQNLVVGESAALAVVAVVVGLAGAWALTRYLEKLLYEVRALDAATFALMPVVLVAIALGAAFVPARRAARVDPIAALREE